VSYEQYEQYEERDGREDRTLVVVKDHNQRGEGYGVVKIIFEKKNDIYIKPDPEVFKTGKVWINADYEKKKTMYIHMATSS